jgi:hypothetical protein
MSSSVGDLSVGVRCDVSELTAGMETSREQLNLTTTTIQVQDSTWRSLAQSAVQSAGEIAPAIGQITSAATDLAATAIKYAALAPLIKGSVAAMGGLTSVASGVGSALAGSAVVATGAVGLLSGILKTFGSTIASVVGFIVPEWKLVTTAISASLLVYKVATSDIAQESYKAVVGSASVSSSFGKMETALGKLGEAAAEPFVKLEAGAEGFLQSINPIPYILGTIEKKVSSWVDTATAGIESLTPIVVDHVDNLEALFYFTEGLGTVSLEQAANFAEESKALRELATATEAAIAKQEAQASLYENIGALQRAATDSAKQSAEVRRIGNIETIEGLDAELRALQARAQAEIAAGKATEESQKKLGQLFAAVANQREAIPEAAAKKAQDEDKAAAKKAQDDQKRAAEDIEKALENARNALFALEFGQDAAALAALRAKGATDEQVQALLKLQEATAAVKAEQEAVKEQEQAMHDAAREFAADQKKWEDEQAKAAEDAQKTWERGEEQIAKLKDELALLTGTATEADVALLEARRAGFSEEQAQEIASLTDQLDGLKQEEKLKGQGAAFAEFGSSSSFSNIFAAMRSGQQDKQNKQIELAEEQNEKFDTELELLQDLIDKTPDVQFVAGLL